MRIARYSNQRLIPSIFFICVFAFPGFLFAENLRLWEAVRGAYSADIDSSPPSSVAPTPPPLLILSRSSWNSFLDGMPKTVANPDEIVEEIGDETVENFDPLMKRDPPDFSRVVVAVVFQNANRVGPIRLGSATVVAQTLKLKTSTLFEGIVARKPNDFVYTAFFLPKNSNLDGTIQHENTEVRQKNRHWIAQDEATSLYGIRATEKNKGWLVKPVWAQATAFDEYGNAWVVDPGKGWILINSDGAQVLRGYISDNGPDYTSEGLFRYQDSKNLIGYADLSGKIVIPAQFEFADPFESGKAAVFRGGEFKRDGEYLLYVGGEANAIDPSGQILGDWTSVTPSLAPDAP